ncbi:replication initiator [Streptomyces poriticola]|uniref:replication initiator n=1 Tax=Streptomyces poriticola TaxID=3120506 RepID=UPI0038CDA49D
MLGLRGRFSTKSRRCSATLRALRDARAEWRHAQATTPTVPQGGETTSPEDHKSLGGAADFDLSR